MYNHLEQDPMYYSPRWTENEEGSENEESSGLHHFDGS